MPGLNLVNLDAGPEMNMAPYLQLGFMMPQTSSMRFYVDLRIAQHIMPVTTLNYSSDTYDYYNGYTYVQTTQTDRPFEIGINAGIAWQGK
jgi:hypothetical protein